MDRLVGPEGRSTRDFSTSITASACAIFPHDFGGILLPAHRIRRQGAKLFGDRQGFFPVSHIGVDGHLRVQRIGGIRIKGERLGNKVFGRRPPSAKCLHMGERKIGFGQIGYQADRLMRGLLRHRKKYLNAPSPFGHVVGGDETRHPTVTLRQECPCRRIVGIALDQRLQNVDGFLRPRIPVRISALARRNCS